MADATDWNDLRISGESWLECEDTQGAHDLSHWALNFIPERPNDPADAEWLKERGWVDSDTGTMLEFMDMIYFRDVGDFSVGGRFHSGLTRMTVALFEAAAMEAMKHGE